MKYLFILLLVSLSYSDSLFVQELKPWEKLGTTSKEYYEAQLRNFPEDSIRYIISYGIGISEYFSAPWIKLNISIDQWLLYRKQGLSDEDIHKKLYNKTVIQPQSYQSIKFDEEDTKERRNINGRKIKSFLLPGYIQLSESKNKKGILMVSVATVGLGATIADSVNRGYFMPTFFIALVIPDMFWSYIDAKK